MPIIKKVEFSRTTILTNEFLQNPKISLGAKGLLGYMLSLPNDWNFTIEGIASQTSTSSYMVGKLLHELEDFGYHTKKHIYENGKIKDWIYYVSADILPEEILKKSEEQDITDTSSCNTSSCKRGDKQTIFNKLNIDSNTKEININTQKLKTPFSKLENIEDNEKQSYLKSKKYLEENIKCIIDYLNESTNKHFKYTSKGTIILIKARFKEGYKLDDFYDVIDKKVKEWLNTDMDKYLRPETLFGNKFENYLNEKIIFNGKPKITYSNTPTFDNTASHNIPKGVASMTKEERRHYEENELAKDENGNLIKF